MYEHSPLDDADAVTSNFMHRVSSPDSLPYCYGLSNTLSALKHAAVDTVIVWKELDILRLQTKSAEASDDTDIKFASPHKVNLPHTFTDPETGSNLHILTCERVVDWMRARLEDGTPQADWQPGVKVIFVS